MMGCIAYIIANCIGIFIGICIALMIFFRDWNLKRGIDKWCKKIVEEAFEEAIKENQIKKNV